MFHMLLDLGPEKSIDKLRPQLKASSELLTTVREGGEGEDTGDNTRGRGVAGDRTRGM